MPVCFDALDFTNFRTKCTLPDLFSSKSTFGAEGKSPAGVRASGIGHKGGEVAGAIAVETVQEIISRF